MKPSATLVALSFIGSIAPPPADAAWTQASSRHFVVYSEDKPARLREFAEKLERFDQAVRRVGHIADVELGPANRLTVYVVRDVDAVRNLANGQLVGFYLARTSGALAVVPQDSNDSGTFAQSVLFHEYAHHLLLSNYFVVWPIWLSEGFAEFYGTAEIDKEGAVEIGLPLRNRAFTLVGGSAATTGSHLRPQAGRLPLDQLLTMSYSQRLEETSLLYARGWLLVHHLNFEPKRRGQLDRYLAALESGTNSAEAATASFGDLAVLDRDLDAYLDQKPLKYLKVPGDQLNVGAITLRSLSPGEQAVMQYRIRSDVGVNEVQARQVAASVSKLAAGFPNDAAVQVVLAEAQFDVGNTAVAEAAADRAIAADRTAVKAYIYKALVQMAAARKTQSRDPAVWREVRNTLLAANRLDPDDPQPLALFYQTFDASGESPTENAIAALHRAQELAPQVTELRLMAGYQYLAEGEIEPARKVLGLLAFQPHASQLGAKVVSVLRTLEQAGAPAALETFRNEQLKSW